MTHAGLPSPVDPETHEPLRLATEAELSLLREALAAGRARRADGLAAPEAFEGAHLNESRARAYLIFEGVPNFIVSERIELDGPLGTAG